MRGTCALDAIGNTPLVGLPKLSPPGGAPIYVKWEGANPTGSMKDRMALAMVERAEREGFLKPGQRVVEFTGGSTGASLALVCAVKGYPLSIVTTDAIAEEKVKIMRALGAEVDVLQTPNRRMYPGLMDRARERVAEIQKAHNAYWTDQFNNPHQLDGYAPFAREILQQCPEVTDFCMIVGTAGCAMGTSRGLRAAKPGVRVSLVEPDESAYLTHCIKGAHCVEGTALGIRPSLLDERLYDRILCLPEEEGRAVARRLATEEGLLCGTSTGMNVAAALRLARDLPPEAAVVTVACDTGLKYLSGDLYRLTCH